MIYPTTEDIGRKVRRGLWEGTLLSFNASHANCLRRRGDRRVFSFAELEWAPEEPTFILRGSDPRAGGLVRLWAEMRERDIKAGHYPASDQDVVVKARLIADAMTIYARDLKKVEEWPPVEYAKESDHGN